MKIQRVWTRPGESYPGIEFTARTVTARGTHAGGPITAPKDWDQTAVDVLASKFMRRAGVPRDRTPVPEEGVPDFLWRSVAAPATTAGGETDARDVFRRLAGCWTYWGWKLGYFDTEADAEAYYDEMRYLLASRRWAPNSPQWFNTGLHWAYGVTGPDSGQWCIELSDKEGRTRFLAETGGVELCKVAYTRPAANACFILNVEDSLLEPGGIYDALAREARVFKFGGGCGANFSKLRGYREKLSGGGFSSGLMSFLPTFDAGGGAIKSGGVTRRAAKMIVLDADHPDIEEFVRWKAEEEYHVAALVAGDKLIRSWAGGDAEPGGRAARGELIPEGFRQRKAFADEHGAELVWPAEPYNTHFEGKGSGYAKAAGQNANNSVRVTHDFMERVEKGQDWQLKARLDGAVVKTLPARRLWDLVCRAAYTSADPGVQFHTTVNDWNPVLNDAEIRATNPCGEYHFVDDTACNLGSHRLTMYAERHGDGAIDGIDLDGFRHGVRLTTLALDVTVSMGGYPSKEIADGSRKYRTLGLGYCDLGAFLMQAGVGYDSDAGRAWCAALTSLMQSEALRTSAELARHLGAFPRYAANREHTLRMVRNHTTWAVRLTGDHTEAYEKLTVHPADIHLHRHVTPEIVQAVKEWAVRANADAESWGLRNAQVSLIAPTGTIGLYLGCDTTGIEPDFALVKDKKLVGGGYMKLVNGSLPAGLAALGYPLAEAGAVCRYVFGTRKLPADCAAALARLGRFEADELDEVEKALAAADTLEAAVRGVRTDEQWAGLLGAWAAPVIAEFAAAGTPFRPLATLLVTRGHYDIDSAVGVVDGWEVEAVGFGSVEGAPHLAPEHYHVFDCANPSGRGTSYLAPLAHVRMMAAAQPALSGAISKTINLPPDATPGDVDAVFVASWKGMVKATTVYIDGQKMSQPLNANRGSAGGRQGVAVEALDPAVVPLVVPAGLAAAPVMADRFAPLDAPEDVGAWAVGFGPEPAPSYPDAPAPEAPGGTEPAERPGRERLPDRRGGYTQKFKLGGQTFYMRTGEYPDGRLGEVFIDTANEGAAFRAIGNALAIAISLGLQHGVPLDEYVDAFVGTRFEPAGVLQGHPRLRMAGSFLDAIFRDLGITYLGRDELAHVQPDQPDAGRPQSAGLAAGLARDLTAPAFTPPRPAVTAPPQTVEAAAPRPPAPPRARPAAKVGYTGNACPRCHNFTLKKAGPCLTCDTCFFDTGCG